MRRYLFDTGIAGDYIDGRNRIFERAQRAVSRGSRIGICVPLLGELYYGIEFSETKSRNLKRLQIALVTLTIWPYTEQAAAEFGRLSAQLRRMGRPIQQVDIQVASIALTLGRCTVVSTDKDLLTIPGLKVENWAE